MINFRYLVTTALPYVNNIPHLGTLLGSGLCADVYARFLRLKNEDVIFVGGADEHGTPITVAAMKEKMDTQQLCDKYYKMQTEVFKAFNISFDNYTRTTAKEHTKMTQDFYYKVKQNNYIFTKEIEQLYCEKCQMFLPDRYVEGVCHWCGAPGSRGDQCDACGKLIDPLLLKDPYCIVCKSAPAIKKTKHSFFELSKLQNKLREWVESQTEWPDNSKTTAIAWLDRGLDDRCITRDLKWGVPVLDLPGKVFYVWFDAPIGYITACKQIKRESWWHDKNVKIVQFMGKDNIPFHTVFFPGMLLAAGDYNLPSVVWSSEYINYEGGKFSKSLNQGVFLDKALEILPPDYWRYYLIASLPEYKDTDFTWKDFQEKVNSDLNDAIGNFVNRVLTLTNKFFDRKIPAERDEKIISEAKKLADEAQKNFAGIHLKEGLKSVVSIARLGNEYLSREEPWKNDNKEKVLGTCLQLCKVLSVYLEPIIPNSADKIKSFLGVEKIKFDNAFAPLTGKIGKFEILFNKAEDKDIEKWKAMCSGKKEMKYVQYNDFAKLEIRVAEVLKAEKVEGSEKLLKLTLNDGNGERTVVAGIAQFYTPAKLKKKHILLLANLEPKKIMGIESRGMVLSTEKGDKLQVIFTKDEVGAKVC